MATPATRTPIKLARGSYSNLYASIDDLQEGEIVYAEDQNQLYVKEGSQLIDVTGDGGGGGGSTNLSYTTSGAGLSLVSSSGSNTNLPAATTDAWGLMTDEDKTNLDANTAKVTNATHTGDVTGSGALTIADDKIEEKHINAGGTPGADKVLVYDSGEATNWKWADQSGSGSGTPEGTAVLSSGETGTTKFLRVDGDGSCSWQVPPDTNTQVSIDDTPVNGVTDEAISSNWAYDHNAATGNSAHVPAAGSSGQFLKHDGTWGTPPDTNTQLTEEQVEDFVGGMVTGNTETGITVTYQDDDGTLDFVVADQTPEGTAILSTGETGGTKFLREDGDGTCSWQTVSGGGGGGTPGGSNTQVQYNSSGSFAGSSNLTFDGTNLAVGGTATAVSPAVAAAGLRKIFTSASSPQASDGAVGDIWLKF